MCGTEYGGGGGGERRVLGPNQLTGPLPVELGNLVNLVELCVRPAPPPHLAMWVLLSTCGSLAGWVNRCGEGRRVFV
jgi:hypothetical protein